MIHFKDISLSDKHPAILRHPQHRIVNSKSHFIFKHKFIIINYPLLYYSFHFCCLTSALLDQTLSENRINNNSVFFYIIQYIIIKY